MESFYDLTPYVRAKAKNRWMVGQMQRNPNLHDDKGMGTHLPIKGESLFAGGMSTNMQIGDEACSRRRKYEQLHY